MKQPFHYVALGDSITAGYSAPDKKGYVTILGHLLKEQFGRVRVSNFGLGGNTSRRLLSEILRNPIVQQEIIRADLLTVYIGGNDLKNTYLKYLLRQKNEVFLDTIESFGSRLEQIYHAIQQMSKAPLLTLNLYNPFPHSEIASTWIPALNGAIDMVSIRRHIPVIDIYSRFKQREMMLIHNYRTGTLKDFQLFGGNPIHPNFQGHQVIAHTLWQHIELDSWY